jgi:hypothetical protein
MDKVYLTAKKHYPRFAWIVNVYKSIMGGIFNAKELVFNKLS